MLGEIRSRNVRGRCVLMLMNKLRVRIVLFAVALMVCGVAARAQDADVAKKLQGFDAYMEQTLKDWNTPGVGVGIVVNDKLVFAKGYGYRDYEKKLPFTLTSTRFVLTTNWAR